MSHNGGMNKNLKTWLETTLQRRITVQEIGNTIGVSRKTATRRVAEEFTTDEIITITTTLGAPPAKALLDLGILTEQQLLDALPDHAQPLSTLTDAELAHELFRRLAQKETPNDD